MAWSTILLKDSHLFEIADLEKILKQKLITNSAILNKRKSFSGMVDKWHGPPKDCIISPTNWLNKKKKKKKGQEHNKCHNIFSYLYFSYGGPRYDIL